ncbi:MAG: hypothetical protein HY675_24465 [Chloroflexi bacterium]|nr:hypothetical protein [Chloroflexota bacterium]
MALVIIATGCLFVRLFGLNATGTGDVFIWERFARNSYSLGAVAGMAASRGDYPPLFFYLAGAITHLIGPLTRQGIKVVLLAFELLLVAALLWDGSRLARRFNRVDSILVYVANPAMILNATLLGYLDVIPAAFFVAALVSLRKGHAFWCGALFGLASLSKWQPNVLLPVMAAWCLALLLASRFRPEALSFGQIRKQIVVGGIGYAAVLAAMLLPFVASGSFGAILDSLKFATGHSAFSQNQLNLGWLVIVGVYLAGRRTGDIFGFTVNGTEYEPFRWAFIGAFAIFTLIIALSAVRYLSLASKEPPHIKPQVALEVFVHSLVLAYWGYVVFGFSVHENHLALIIPIACLLGLWNSRYLSLYLTLSVVSFLNMYLFFGPFGDPLPGGRGLIWHTASALLPLINIVALLYFTRDYVARCWRVPAPDQA